MTTVTVVRYGTHAVTFDFKTIFFHERETNEFSRHNKSLNRTDKSLPTPFNRKRSLNRTENVDFRNAFFGRRIGQDGGTCAPGWMSAGARNRCLVGNLSRPLARVSSRPRCTIVEAAATSQKTRSDGRDVIAVVNKTAAVTLQRRPMTSSPRRGTPAPHGPAASSSTRLHRARVHVTPRDGRESPVPSGVLHNVSSLHRVPVLTSVRTPLPDV